jgi:hypothetical protein
MPHIYPWETIYKAALVETDPAKRSAAITAAEQTVLRRVSELERTATRRSINELAWLEKAIEGLAKLHEDDVSKTKAPPDGALSLEAPPVARAKTTGC